MKRVRVWVAFSDPAVLEKLESECPGYAFQTGQPAGASIAVVDAQSAGTESEERFTVRIVLDGSPGSRRPRDLLLPREVFIGSPSPYLDLARELSEVMERSLRQERELDFLKDIQELTTLADSEAVSQRITRAVLEILRIPFGTLLLHDPRVERFVVSYSNDPEHRETGEFLPGIPARLLQKALSSSSPWALDPPFNGRPGLLVMPIEIQEDVIGVLKIPVRSEDAFEEGQAERAAQYIGMVTSVLGNIYLLTRSKDLAMRDDLTKAYNRRFFDSYLDEEIERARRYGAVFSIIFLDLDDLKLVNNLYGHLVGSRTLQEVAKRILGAVRAIDKVVRFGGDEFCIILPQTDQEQAASVGRRVQRAIAGAPFPIEPGIEVTITASFGIAAYPIHATTKEELVRQADAAMYRVKSTTKNAIGVAQPPVIRPLKEGM